MRRVSSALLSALVFSWLLTAATPATAVVPSTDGSQQVGGVAQGYAIVILSDAPLADWPGAARAKNGKIDFNSGTNGRYQAALSHARNDFKQWLRSSGSPAEVLREYDTVLNGVALRLNGASLDSLRAGPGVTLVEPSLLYAPSMDRSNAIISAPAAWAALGGAANAGAGVKVGVIDTGIDLHHPFLTDSTLTPPAGFPKFDAGNQQFTSNKVIVARVYFTGKPGTYTAEALQDHGTHVSGTIAGVHGTTAPASGSIPAVTGLTGIAPKAFLGNYNVFPGPISNATSHDIAEAIEDAVKDGMDVINMSLGGGINGYKDQLTVATDRATHAGVVVAIAAGNSGPGVNTVESPGQAPGAITAAAATNNHFFGIPVVTDNGTFGAAAGNFNPFNPSLTASLAAWSNPGDAAGATRACAGVSGTPYAGAIVILDRGACTFTTKVRNAELAGAVGVLVVNNSAGDPSAMGQDGTAPVPTIPAVMVGLGDGPALRGATTATVDGSMLTEVFTANENYLASFSSRGPANLLDVKPDVTAPGVNIYSSIPGGEYAMFQGTSMATPHVAGSAALIVQLHPDWTPAMVKSALVDTARRPAHLGNNPNPQNVGGGVIDLAAATTTSAVLEPASLSFRKIEPTSGQAKTIAVTLTNVSGVTQSFGATATITRAPAAGAATASVAPAAVTLANGQAATLIVTVDAGKTAPDGQYWGDLVVTDASGKVVRAPLWFAVRTTTDAGPLY